MTSSRARLPTLGGLILLLMLASTLMLASGANAARKKKGGGQPLLGIGPPQGDALDQLQPQATSTETIGGPSSPSPVSEAQTFTAGRSGQLDHARLYLSGSSSDTGGLTVEIATASGGTPTDTVLASTTVPATAISSAGGWVEADFGSGAPVSIGTQYAIVAYAGGSDVYSWWSSSTNPYAGGEAGYSMASPPSSWTDDPNDDTAFMTFVRCAVLATARDQATPDVGMAPGSACGQGGGGGFHGGGGGQQD